MRQEIKAKHSEGAVGIRDSVDTQKLGDNLSVKQSTYMRRRQTMVSGLLFGSNA